MQIDLKDIKAFICETGLSPHVIAKEAGISHSSLYRVINEEDANISIKTFNKINEAMARWSRKTRRFRPRKETQSNPE